MSYLPDNLKNEDKSEDKGFGLTVHLDQKFDALKSDAINRLSNYRYYLQWFHGEAAGFLDLPKGRAKKLTNWCARAVKMIANFTLPQIPEVHCPRKTEVSAKTDLSSDVNKELPELGEEFDISEAKEKILRNILNFKQQAKREMKAGMETGLVNGDTVLYHPWCEKENTVLIQNIFPGFVRMKFSNSNFDKEEYAFITKICSVDYIKKTYGITVPATSYGDVDSAGLWNATILKRGRYALVKIFIDDTYEIHYTGTHILKKQVHNSGVLPFTWIPALRDSFSPYGISYLKDLIPVVKEHNEVNSDEEAIAKLFSRPKVIIRNATQKDIDNIKKMWKSGIVASKGNLEVAPFEFKNNIFPIEQRKSNVEQRFYQLSGLGPTVFGMPPGSINTGASLTVQYAPTLQMGQIIWDSWEPKLLMMFEKIFKMLEKKGKDPESKVSYKKIINGNYEVEMRAPFKVPREESIHVANVINKLQAGIISKTTAMVELGIKSPQDELVVQAWEKFHPLLNPELLEQMQETKQPAAQQRKQTPQQGAEMGGQRRAQQAATSALGGQQPTPKMPTAGFRGSAPTNIK